jgi:hypothetical protein
MSLWDPPPHGKRPPSALAGLVVRPLTDEEARQLRAIAEKAERESPFQDHVSDEAMSLRLD